MRCIEGLGYTGLGFLSCIGVTQIVGIVGLIYAGIRKCICSPTREALDDAAPLLGRTKPMDADSRLIGIFSRMLLPFVGGPFAWDYAKSSLESRGAPVGNVNAPVPFSDAALQEAVARGTALPEWAEDASTTGVLLGDRCIIPYLFFNPDWQGDVKENEAVIIDACCDHAARSTSRDAQHVFKEAQPRRAIYRYVVGFHSADVDTPAYNRSVCDFIERAIQAREKVVVRDSLAPIILYFMRRFDLTAEAAAQLLGTTPAFATADLGATRIMARDKAFQL